MEREREWTESGGRKSGDRSGRERVSMRGERGGGDGERVESWERENVWRERVEREWSLSEER